MPMKMHGNGTLTTLLFDGGYVSLDLAKTLVLHSCATGAECVSPEMQEVLLCETGTETINLKTNIAKELSKHLENIMIIAPSERISPTQTYGLWGDYNGERILNGGHWNVYKNGKNKYFKSR